VIGDTDMMWMFLLDLLQRLFETMYDVALGVEL